MNASMFQIGQMSLKPLTATGFPPGETRMFRAAIPPLPELFRYRWEVEGAGVHWMDEVTVDGDKGALNTLICDGPAPVDARIRCVAICSHEFELSTPWIPFVWYVIKESGDA
jgi:hypothetical protein